MTKHLRRLEPLIWARELRLGLVAQMEPSWIGTEPHWACPSCGVPCFCDGGARLLRHRDCGRWEP